MTPGQAIASLDRQLALHGRAVTVRRYTAASGTPRPKTDVAARAVFRPLKAEQLAAGIAQTSSNVVLSPTATGLSALLPLRRGDKIVVGTKEHDVEDAKPIYIGDTLVRIDMVVTG